MILSVITINYNNCSGFSKTAESVINQTFDDFEWIVIDGDSNDGSKELIEKYSSRIAYGVSEKDEGIYNAMNKGILKARGEYILFLNSGDWLFSDNILSECSLQEHHEDVLYGEISFCHNGIEYQKSKLPDTLGMTFLTLNFIGHSSNCFIKRLRLLEFPYDEKLKIVSDWKFYIQTALAGATFKHLNLCIGCYDLSGISERNRELSWKERSAVFETCIPPIIKNDAQLYKQLKANLANTSTEEYLDLRQKHKILGKLITFLIILMKLLK